jgi:hypothetical protein
MSKRNITGASEQSVHIKGLPRRVLQPRHAMLLVSTLPKERL